jgi:hypothetical protein
LTKGFASAVHDDKQKSKALNERRKIERNDLFKYFLHVYDMALSYPFVNIGLQSDCTTTILSPCMFHDTKEVAGKMNLEGLNPRIQSGDGASRRSPFLPF